MSNGISLAASITGQVPVKGILEPKTRYYTCKKAHATQRLNMLKIGY